MPRASRDTTLIVFAKSPQPGAVKTRLAPLLGEHGAAALQARLIKHALATARAARIGEFELHCAPDCEDPFLRRCGSQYAAPLRSQTDGDLGKRMLAAFEHALSGKSRAILIGTDCPALTVRHLRNADRFLRSGEDAVFIPAEDGGYALIGLARCDPLLFQGVSWGTSSVMNGTRARLRDLGWRWRELATLWDVDRPEDYRRLIASGLIGPLVP
jgi:uncharacterized protein